jgi:hypothetical protein
MHKVSVLRLLKDHTKRTVGAYVMYWATGYQSYSTQVISRIWGFHGEDYEERLLLGYKNPDRISQETHYVSVKEPSLLVLCRIWSCHGGDYQECRLRGYKNPVRIPQEKYSFSITEPNRLILCKILGFHSGDHEEWRLLQYDIVWLL